MKLLVGLGNPGTKYMKNRHNVGHMLVEFLEGGPHHGFKLFKTDCYMNQSGGFVKKLLNTHKTAPDSLYIAHDDLDIPLGKFKIHFGTGPKVHNGINSIADALGTEDFWRIRIGVDARTPDNRVDGETYVLEDFTIEDFDLIKKTFPRIPAHPLFNTSGS